MNKDNMIISQLLEENLEQARLLGMSAEREAALQTKIDQIQQIKSASGIEAMVCLDIMVRQEQGIKKYGMTVAENPLSLKQWLQHAYEECLDQAIYLKRAIEENDKVIKETAKKCAEIADIAEPYKADDLIRKYFGVEE